MKFDTSCQIRQLNCSDEGLEIAGDIMEIYSRSNGTNLSILDESPDSGDAHTAWNRIKALKWAEMVRYRLDSCLYRQLEGKSKTPSQGAPKYGKYVTTYGDSLKFFTQEFRGRMRDRLILNGQATDKSVDAA